MRTGLRTLLLIAQIVQIVSIGASNSHGSAALLPGVSSPLPPGVRLLHADHSGLTLEWIAPSVQVQPLADGTVEVAAKDAVNGAWAQTQYPGMPRLPFASALIALPPDAHPRLSFLSIEETAQSLPAPVALSPWPEGVLRDARGRPIGGTFAQTHARHPNVGQASQPVVLEEVGIVRGVRLARLTFYPALPEGQVLRLIQRLRVQVSWESLGHQARSPSSLPDSFLEQVQQAVLNPWDAVPAPSSTASVSLQPANAVPTAFVEITTTGIYRVTHDDLDSLGLADTDPRNLRLFRGELEVAYEWEGDDDAIFEPGEGFLFYAEPRFSRWTDGDVYRLAQGAAGDTPGLHMATRSADPAGLPAGIAWVEQMFEENHIYTPDCLCGSLPPGHDGDRWVWEDLRRPDRATVSYPFHVSAVDASQPASLTLTFIGYTSVAAAPDHRVEAALGEISTLLGEVEWDGKTAITATLPIPAELLRSGHNTLTLTLPGIPDVSVEGAWLDAFAVRYARSTVATGDSLRFGGLESPPHYRRAYTVALASSGPYYAYDVTDPLNPQKLTDFKKNGNNVTVGDPASRSSRRYFLTAESGILRPMQVRAAQNPFDLPGSEEKPAGADYLIITHPAFAAALEPLVNLRQSHGLATAVVDAQGIYDVWGDGRPDPEAIRAFVADVYANWQPRPIYLLLVGDGSFDPRRYRSDSPPTFVPPYLADVDPWAGETAADNRYVCVDGDDGLPDLLLGRLPVQTVEEAQIVVDKIVHYETEPFPGGWNADVLLVADDADAAGDFAASSDEHAAAHVGAPFAATRRYCAGTNSYTSDCSAQETVALHEGSLSNWNKGTFLIQFTGHSSWQQWAAESFFHLDDLYTLHNDRRLPVVVEMTCFTGAFQRPESTLDEALITLAEGGAAAAWGATGLGVSTGHAYLSEGFFRDVFTQEVDAVGEATLAGKLALVANGQNLDLVDTFILLGDPALRLNREMVPWAGQIFLPLVSRRR
jgi:hypothetical protein